PLPEALDAVRDWYAARGLPALVEVVTPGTPDDLRALLGPLRSPTLVRTAPLAGVARAGAGHERVRLSRTADQAWMSLDGRLGEDPAVREAARQVLHGGPSVWFATAPGAPGQPPLAIGRCVIDGPWACFGAVEVQPYARRAGLATAVMAV